MPADLNLVFGRDRYTGGPIGLVLGFQDAPPSPDPLTAHGTTVLAPPLGTGLAVYNNRNPLRVSAGTTQRHQPATRAGLDLAMPTQPPTRRLGGTAQPLQRAQAAEGAPRQHIGTQGRVSGDSAQVHQTAAPRETGPAQPHQVLARVRAQAAQAHQVALALQVLAAQLHQAGTLTHARAAEPLQQAQALRALAAQIGGAARFLNFTHVQPFQAARRVPPGKEVWPPIDGGNGPEPYVPDLNLVFACPPYEQGAPLDLVFGHVCLPPVAPGAPAFILPARYYMTAHTLVAHRLPDLAPVPIFDVSISADVGSYGWQFSASAPAGVFEQMAPSAGLAQQIRITLDGIPFAFLVDSLSREERFGRRGVRIAGRSITALLGRPVSRESSRTNAAPFTAQQLALQALDLTGFSLDWGLTDWLVPAGAWSHTGTPLAAVQSIVEAAGGYLQSARNAATLLARHPYPTLAGGMPGGPWNWYAGTVVPDVELAPDALMTTSIERSDGADVNAVYVMGESQGVKRLVKRSGSAADKLAGVVTDPLIVAHEVALQRGTAILGAAGPKHLVRVDLPILTGASQPGVLDVGQLVQVNATQPWRGRVRAVSVSATFGKAVRQSVQIERHLEVAP